MPSVRERMTTDVATIRALAEQREARATTVRDVATYRPVT